MDENHFREVVSYLNILSEEVRRERDRQMMMALQLGERVAIANRFHALNENFSNRTRVLSVLVVPTLNTKERALQMEEVAKNLFPWLIAYVMELGVKHPPIPASIERFFVA